MAKATKEKPSEENQKASMARGVFILPGNAFDEHDGEVFQGLNILKLEVNETAGIFTLKKILFNQKLGKSDKRKPVDVYVAEFNKQEIRMPISASFIGKVKDAKLAVGDTFLVRRDADYSSKEHGTKNCKSYSLKVMSRAKK